jgi:ParB-like chromosome segregation protein Spo0J
VSKIVLGFDPNSINIPLDCILPSRKIPLGLLKSRKYRQILASVREVGVIEPLSVVPAESTPGHYLLLDGHIRLVALRELGHTETVCLVARDNEGYTYNTRINRLSSVQEYRMIRRAIDRGVPREKVADTLGVDITQIHKKASLLDGICDEAIAMLKDRHFVTNVARVLKKMKPLRQIECVEKMIDANKFTTDFANAELAITPPEMLIEGKRPKKTGITAEQFSRMEREMAKVQGKYKLVEQNYGQDVLNLVLAQRYLEKLLANKLVAKYLRQHQPDVMEQFEKIVATRSLDSSQ